MLSWGNFMKINSLRNFILEISNKKMFNFLNVFTKQKQILVFKGLSKKKPTRSFIIFERWIKNIINSFTIPQGIISVTKFSKRLSKRFSTKTSSNLMMVSGKWGPNLYQRSKLVTASVFFSKIIKLLVILFVIRL